MYCVRDSNQSHDGPGYGPEEINIYQLKDHVHVDHLRWEMRSKDSEKQEVAPFDAILDLLGSKNNGAFCSLAVPKNLLLKSSWVERLGGRAKVESSNEANEGLIQIVHTKTGLEIEEDSEDEGGSENEDDEEEDKDEEDYYLIYCNLINEDEDDSMDVSPGHPGTPPRALGPPSTALAPTPGSSMSRGEPWTRDILR